MTDKHNNQDTQGVAGQHKTVIVVCVLLLAVAAYGVVKLADYIQREQEQYRSQSQGQPRSE